MFPTAFEGSLSFSVIKQGLCGITCTWQFVIRVTRLRHGLLELRARHFVGLDSYRNPASKPGRPDFQASHEDCRDSSCPHTSQLFELSSKLVLISTTQTSLSVASLASSKSIEKKHRHYTIAHRSYNMVAASATPLNRGEIRPPRMSRPLLAL
jgi:hypothetical protein